MKTITTLLLVLVAIASNAKDLTIRGFILNDDSQAVVEVYQHGKVIQSCIPETRFYKLKLEPGRYMVLFHTKDVYKRMYIDIKVPIKVQLDVDFSTDDDILVDYKRKQLRYKRLSKEENFELSYNY